MSKIIISCAVTGSIYTPSMSPCLPVTAEVIARKAIDAAPVFDVLLTGANKELESLGEQA